MAYDMEVEQDQGILQPRRYDINTTRQDIWLILNTNARYMHDRYSCASGRSYSTTLTHCYFDVISTET